MNTSEHFGVCGWCRKNITEQPFVNKMYPSINVSSPYHSKCFILAHNALVGLDELINNRNEYYQMLKLNEMNEEIE